jgi:predicted ATPase
MGYNLSWTLWLLGYPDAALVLVERGLASTPAAENPQGWAYLMHFAGVVHELRGEFVAGLARVEAMRPLCERQELRFFVPLLRFQSGFHRAHSGNLEQGVRELQEGIAGMRCLGIGVALSRPYAILAEALMLAGRLDEALLALATGFEFVVEKNERWWESELHRLQGELWLQLQSDGKGAEGCDRGTSGAHDAQGCLLHALEVARGRAALSLELRAAMSLARFWRNTPQRGRGRQILFDVLKSFTEGGETADCRAARALLVSLQ